MQSRSYKIIDEKISQWRKPSEKQAYLAQFSSTRWAKTTQLQRNLHTLQNCRCCKSFHASVSETFPESKNKSQKFKGPFSDIKIKSKNHFPKKATKGELKSVGEMIFSTYDKTCKENPDRPFSEVVLLAVPELNLQEKQSAYEKKKQRLKKKQRQFKASVEIVT